MYQFAIKHRSETASIYTHN